MKTYLNVPCPKCGGDLDVPLVVRDRLVLPWPHVSVLVTLEEQYIDHRCPTLATEPPGS
jgi:hypothetical protein